MESDDRYKIESGQGIFSVIFKKSLNEVRVLMTQIVMDIIF
jgi:hypothetical protein